MSATDRSGFDWPAFDFTLVSVNGAFAHQHPSNVAISQPSRGKATLQLCQDATSLLCGYTADSHNQHYGTNQLILL
jgi:hypothetical protein